MNTRALIMLACLATLISYTAKADIGLKAPASAESGKVIPATFTFSPALKSGETVIVLIEGLTALTFHVNEGTVESFATRFRMERSGNIKAKRLLENKILEENKTRVKIRTGPLLFGYPAPIKRHSIRERKTNGSYKSLFKTKNGFSNTLVLTDNNFNVEVTGSIFIAKSTVVHVKGSFSRNVVSSVKEATRIANRPQSISRSPREPDTANSSSLTRTNNAYNIFGLKLNMTIDEANVIFKKMRAKKYNIKRKKLTFYHGYDNSKYLNSVTASRGDSYIHVEFFAPPHKNTISGISRKRSYENNLSNAPYSQELIIYMSKKHGTPSKKYEWSERSGKTIFFSDYKCIQEAIPGNRRVVYRADQPIDRCGIRFSLTYKEMTDRAVKGKVGEYYVNLSDETAKSANIKASNRKRKQLVREEEVRKAKQRDKAVRSSSFSDEL